MRSIEHHVPPTVTGVSGLMVPKRPDQEKDRERNANDEGQQRSGVDHGRMARLTGDGKATRVTRRPWGPSGKRPLRSERCDVARFWGSWAPSMAGFAPL